MRGDVASHVSTRACRRIALRHACARTDVTSDPPIVVNRGLECCLDRPSEALLARMPSSFSAGSAIRVSESNSPRVDDKSVPRLVHETSYPWRRIQIDPRRLSSRGTGTLREEYDRSSVRCPPQSERLGSHRDV